MLAKITNPGKAPASFKAGRLDVLLAPGASREFDLSGDQAERLRGLGLSVSCPEADAPPPKGSKAALALKAAAKAKASPA